MALRTNVFKPIDGYEGDVSWPQLIVGVLGCLWIPTVAYKAWRSGHAKRQDMENENVQVILPCYVLLLYVATVSTILQSVAVMTVRSSMRNHELDRAIISAAAWGIHRVPLEGFTFFLMHHGAGQRAMLWSMIGGLVFGAANTIAFVPGLIYVDTWGIYVVAGWNLAMALGYGILWLAPANKVYRRPALIPYAGYWTVLRLLLTLAFVLDFLADKSPGHDIEDVAVVLYFVTKGVMFNLITPSILYSALLADSQFWQGYHDTKRSWLSQLTAPLEGIRFSGQSAAGLADSLDAMAAQSQVKQLNFAALQISSSLLGVGGQARVYKGLYRGHPVAVKVVFCIDLTPDVVQDFCNEAKLLARMAHPNVVKSYGVCVVPPTIAIVMELCANGSLHDVLHGEPPKLLTWRAKLLLCRDCTNAIAFLHSKGAVHKDIKSANFLVDANMTAKLADLGVSEDFLGGTLLAEQQTPVGTDPKAAIVTMNPVAATVTGRTSSTQLSSTSVEFRGTLSWAAPEVLSGLPYTPAADVYSLTLVLWEILGGQLPFNTPATSSLNAAELGAAIAGKGDWRKYRPPSCVDDARTVQGLRPVLPLNTPDDFADMLAVGWAASPQARPTAEQLLAMVDAMVARVSSLPIAEQVHTARWPVDSGMTVSSMLSSAPSSSTRRRASSKSSTRSGRASGRMRPSIVSTLNVIDNV